MAAHVVLPWVHRVFSNAKTWALGVYHGLRRQHLQSYLDEFVFRFNRRRTRHAAFRSLARHRRRPPALTYNMLISPEARDKPSVGYDRTRNLAVAKDVRRRMAAIPGLVDVHLQQELDGPDFLANIDRARATQFGLTASGIANDINISLSSSEQVTPNFWTDPANGIPYFLAVQTPQYLADFLNDIKNTPIGAIAAPVAATTGAVPGLLSNVATFTRDTTPTNLNQANIQPLYEILASTQGRDLGSVSSDIDRIVADEQKQLRPGNSIQVVGQISSMNTAFQNMSLGLVFAAIFVYLLMVVNYQTWGDPFVVILALPATLCGAVTMLFITGTTLSVPSLMGMIMAVGVASANSICWSPMRAMSSLPENRRAKPRWRPASPEFGRCS